MNLLLILLLGSTSDVNSRITGGSIASPGNFPFVVQIQINGKHWCSGFIYNYEWIVTTASCVIGYKPETMAVVVGQVSLSNTDPDEETIPALAVFVHEDYDHTTRFNDIAMIQLSKAITVGQYVSMIQYDHLNPVIDEAIALGWADGSTGEITNLRYTTVPIRTNDECSSAFNLLWDANIMICAGNVTNDACDAGDAGGPLVQGTSLENYRVVGLVSHIIECANPLYPTAYTRMSPYFTWINNKGGPQIIPTTPELETTDATPSAPAIHQCTLASDASQFPFMVSILSSTTFDPLCAGFIYNERYVVTTASCVIRKTVSMLNVTVGQYRFDRPELSEKIFPISAVVLHPQYHESSQTNNIAVIEISGSITFGGSVDYCYYDSVDNANPSSTVSGWASKANEGCEGSLTLLWDDSETVQTNEDCSLMLTNFDGLTMLCTKTIPGNCEFESGAPLIQVSNNNPPVVVGIKSVFQKCSQCSTSSAVAYTRISHYWNWLISVAGYQPLK